MRASYVTEKSAETTSLQSREVWRSRRLNFVVRAASRLKNIKERRVVNSNGQIGALMKWKKVGSYHSFVRHAKGKKKIEEVLDPTSAADFETGG